MTKQNKRRTMLDDIADGIRQVLDEIDNLLNPESQNKRKPALVPIPVRRDQPDPKRYR
ncbi:MAG: hypothetical protein RLP44_24020 [Aggregatilineales bacterium]